MKKILIIRLDKIGDLVCSLPIDQILQETHDVHWVIAQGLAFLPQQSVPQRKFIELDKNKITESIKKLSDLIDQYQPEVAISLQAPWWVHWVLFKKRISLRAGVLSKWHSFLFLNKGLRQRRSESTQHEADYNFELLCHALSIPKDKYQAPVLTIKAPRTEETLQKWGLDKELYFVVHPGMAGSALNWSVLQYSQWIHEKLRSQIKIVVTGTRMDEPWTSPLEAEFKGHPDVLFLNNKLTVLELLDVLSGASLVLAPSTGVLHLAASLGTKCYGIFSPLKVQHPTRWQARGPLVKIFVPQISCPEKFHCQGSACQHFNCMAHLKLP